MNIATISEDLAYRIIEKELELEHECNISVVNELVNMYRQLIEAYESAQDPKFADFQTRLHKILMRSDVQEMLKEQSKIEKKKLRDSKEIEMRRQNFRSRKTASVGVDQEKVSKHLSRIMENRQNMDKGTFNKAKNSFKSQNSNLNERLERRRRQSSIKSIRSFRGLNESYLGDEGAGEEKIEELIGENIQKSWCNNLNS